MGRKTHWDRVYQSNEDHEVSWYQPRPETSLQLIERCELSPSAQVIDVGGGTSRLVDCLLDAGYSKVGVLDVSETALERAGERLGDRAAAVQWIVSDATEYEPSHRWDLWHDRAVFHFLVEEADRERYRETLLRSLEPNGHVVMATFGPQGPERCSGLTVVRRDPDSLRRALGSEFELLENLIEEHKTPKGAVQEFLYCRFQRR